jgi:hypothetical protein
MYLGVCDYRWGMDWILALLTTCIHHLELHFTDHWHTQTSVLSLLQSPLAVSWQQIYCRNYNSLTELHIPDITHKVFFVQPHSCNWLFSSQPPIQNSTELPTPTNGVPGWWPFHTNLVVFSSQANFQLNCTLPDRDPCCIASGWTQQKTLFFYYYSCLFPWEHVYWAVA